MLRSCELRQVPKPLADPYVRMFTAVRLARPTEHRRGSEPRLERFPASSGSLFLFAKPAEHLVSQRRADDLEPTIEISRPWRGTENPLL